MKTTLVARIVRWSSLGLALLLMVGCDSATEDTLILDSDSPEPPVVAYTFEYTSDDQAPDGGIQVASAGTDGLTQYLREVAAAERSAVVSARVERVVLERLSSSRTPAAQEKVFDYLVGASVYLGTGTSGPRIATGQFDTQAATVELSVDQGTVTSQVQSGPTRAFLDLDVDAGASVPSSDRVRVTVYLRLEVQ